tara:strand:+ start:789 stop:1016 length:228 start_codon:yes stop_codon:yes gene_type:complete
MNIEVYNFLKKEAEADKAKALASIKLLTGHPAGIGDHSTKDYWDNCTEALKLLASAEERLEVLEKYFNNKEQVNG